MKTAPDDHQYASRMTDTTYHVIIALFRLVGNCGWISAVRPRTRWVTHPLQTCPKSSRRLSCVVRCVCNVESGGDVHAMPATAHGLLVSKTLCRTRPMMASWTMQRNAEVTSELPTPRWRVEERTALKRIKERPRPTLAQVKLVVSPGVASMLAQKKK